MAGYKPAAPFRTAMRLLNPSQVNIKGVNKQVYPDPEHGATIYGTFRTFGGTETVINGMLTVTGTGYIDTWYRSDIRSDSRFYIVQTGETYEVLGRPENINMQNQYMKVRVREIGGRP
jgi:head-tail adaptor